MPDNQVMLVGGNAAGEQLYWLSDVYIAAWSIARKITSNDPGADDGEASLYTPARMGWKRWLCGLLPVAGKLPTLSEPHTNPLW